MTFKLLIFDLDDTLIDTFSTFSPSRLSDSLQTMIDYGLKIDSPSEALKRLIEIDSKSSSVKETIKNFVTEISAFEVEKYSSIGIKKYYEEFKGNCQLKPVDGALELLQKLQKRYNLAIVSKGLKETQYWKINKAGIKKECFKKIIIVSEEKKTAYASLLQENGYKSSEVLVCGDKYELDLVPAKELGLTTIYFIWGRAKNNKNKVITDYTINDLKEILKIVKLKE